MDIVWNLGISELIYQKNTKNFDWRKVLYKSPHLVLHKNNYIQVDSDKIYGVKLLALKTAANHRCLTRHNITNLTGVQSTRSTTVQN